MAKTKLVEQHISGVKLEKQRKDACLKNNLFRKLPIPLFLVFMIYPTIKLVIFIQKAQDPNSGLDAKSFVLYYLAHDGMMSLVLTGACMGILFGLYRKSYSLFTKNFKNKYLTDTLKSVSGFSNLEYAENLGFTYDEIKSSAIVPAGLKSIFISRDQLTGSFKNVDFRSGNITTATSRGRHVEELFTGQLIEFSYFDKSKISDGRVQIFSNKSLAFYEKLYKQSNDSIMGRQKLPFKIETEDAEFNMNFAVYGDHEHNAFYILTPPVIECIKELSKIVEDDFYLVFENQKLWIAFYAFRNPFDAYVDVPVEEQRKFIIKDANLLQCAANILVQD